MHLFQQSESVAARRDLFVAMVLTSDHVTPATGKALTVELVKAGGSAFAAIAGSSAEVANGCYRVSLAAADLDTLGGGMIKITAAATDQLLVPIRVVRFIEEVHLAKAALLNKRLHTVATGVNVIKDDDGATTLKTLTPAEAAGVVTVTPS